MGTPACIAVIAPRELLLCGSPNIENRVPSLRCRCELCLRGRLPLASDCRGGTYTADVGRPPAELDIRWLRGIIVGYWGN